MNQSGTRETAGRIFFGYKIIMPIVLISSLSIFFFKENIILIAFNEQFTALQQGTIDACENGVSGCYTNGFYEVTKNITNTKQPVMNFNFKTKLR